jgi:hypothetical protein
MSEDEGRVVYGQDDDSDEVEAHGRVVAANEDADADADDDDEVEGHGRRVV